MFHRYNKLEQLEFKLEKIIGIQKHAGKVRKIQLSICSSKGMLKEQIQAVHEGKQPYR